MPEPETPPIPTLIGERYRVLSELGRGGYGTVYLVNHVHTGERFALKVLHGQSAHNAEAVSRFAREMRMPAAIRSPHVVKVTDAGAAAELGGALFMVMELLDGMDINRLLTKRVRMTSEEALWTLNQVGRGLQKIHGAGLVHRDLKPENIFIHRRDEGGLVVKILDFGLVRQSKPIGALGNAQLTQLGTILGTPLYVSPEQALGETVGPQADIWALGLIAYEMLTGTTYWENDSLSALLVRVVRANLKLPSEQAPGLLPPAFDGWFLRTCARDPKARFQSVAQQLTALAAALALPSALADDAPPPAVLHEFFRGQPSIDPTAEPPPVGPTSAALSKSSREVTARVEPRSPQSPSPTESKGRPRPRRIVLLLGALGVLLLLALVLSAWVLRRPVQSAALPPSDKKAAQKTFAVPPAAPLPKENSAPLATPAPQHDNEEGEVRKHKQRKKSKSPADGSRDPSSFDPAAP